ncbi:type I restriction-modification system subunit M [Mycoplasmopsis caviae]|uniref:site-specific DNA-methyltransferase (adenine-specific) n=1 Tax=Mycoplasmopsis caviae TaxID=55603 RepID=A0A3P8KAP5_9BACT|nr:type I restriction-modification system subunit M [Mycoplasmopsis caviae]UUD35479.1 type I restriction-modification system subunit M [Mycoplasmopsis caviae]VDR41744.1 Probable type I restriction enzyme BthVORF4518P M protein [Mycoplasmopsis caviae]
MNNKKELERRELHKTIWNMADQLRGAIDGWDFKSYVLGFLFYRYISEGLTQYINKDHRDALEEVNCASYETMTDEQAEGAKETIIKAKGYFIRPSELFINVAKNCDSHKEDLNELLQKAFNNIEASAIGTSSEKDIKGLFADINLTNTKLGNTVIEKNERLIKIIQNINSMNLGSFEDNTIDAFGDAYEFLMGMYAQNAGKSGGEFFTPQEVSELLAKLTLIDYSKAEKPFKNKVLRVYDPACGSGSLLLKFAKVLGAENVGGFYGQEINHTTYNLARINMFLHNVGFNKFEIALGDTLIKPDPGLDTRKPFEAIVSNPPYSIKWEGDNNPLLINDERFAPAGVLAPKSKADFAFLMHSLHYLKENGTAAIVIFPGTLYRSGAEAKIRKYLVEQNFVDSIIQLPDDLFFGTSISTCIIVFRKNKNDNNVLFVNASDLFERSGIKNKLTGSNIDKILTYIKDRKDFEGVTKLATYQEIVENNYDLSINTYIKKQEVKEKINIKELNQKIKETVSRIDVLRKEIDKIVEEIEGMNN